MSEANDEQQAGAENANEGLESALSAIAQADPDEFARTLHKTSQPHYQKIFNAGHSVAKERYEAKERELAAKIQEAQQAIEEREAKLAELSEAQPDLDAIQKRYEDALKAKDQEAQQARQDAAERIAAIKEARRAERQDAILGGLAQKLLQMGVIDADYARIRAHDPALKDRVKVQEGEAGRLLTEVYQPDGMTPYSVPEGQTATDLLAQEIFATVPDSLKRDTSPGQSGIGKANGRASTGAQKAYAEMTLAEKKQHIAAQIKTAA